MSLGSDDKGVLCGCPSCGQMNRVSYGTLQKTTRCAKCKTELPKLAGVVEFGSGKSFDAALTNASLPVLVDFWASWCGPCKMMAPELERFAASSAGGLLVGKVNTEELPELAQRHQISALPTLVLFIGGSEVSRAQGARSANQIAEFISSAVVSA